MVNKLRNPIVLNSESFFSFRFPLDYPVNITVNNSIEFPPSPSPPLSQESIIELFRTVGKQFQQTLNFHGRQSLPVVVRTSSLPRRVILNASPIAKPIKLKETLF